MQNSVKIVECPRDAWQGMPLQIPPEKKANYLKQLVTAGFSHIDAVSFVSPTAVPQMADSEKVLAHLQPPENVEVIGIAVNPKGAERAIHTGFVRTLGFPYSVSSTFLSRNQNQTPKEALQTLEAIVTLAHRAGVVVAAYVSMAFGNPYGDKWHIDEVRGACRLLVDIGIREISLADTVGMASSAQISEVFSEVIDVSAGAAEIGVHLHARNYEASAKIEAAYQAGCRRFDAAMGGLGGCPFAQDSLVGNIATEVLIETLKGCGAQLPVLSPLQSLIEENTRISREYGPSSHTK